MFMDDNALDYLIILITDFLVATVQRQGSMYILFHVPTVKVDFIVFCFIQLV